LAIGVFGYVLAGSSGSTRRRFCSDSCWGRRLEENFRLALLISYGDLGVFVERPISGDVVAERVLLIAGPDLFPGWAPMTASSMDLQVIESFQHWQRTANR